MSAPRRRSEPPRQFNPSVLVRMVAESLAYRYGIAIEVGSDNVCTAVTAAADLLRALHIEPTAVPRLPLPTEPVPAHEGLPIGGRHHR